MSKCYYCTFYSVVFDENLANEYLKSLKKEIDYYKDNYNLENIETLYIGGGTPSISLQHLEKINRTITSSTTLNNLKEYTIEFNPLNISIDHIRLLEEIRCSRVSLGIQSFNEDSLDKCKRNQNNKNVINSLILLNENNFNISIDLIDGLPFLDHKIEIKNLDRVLNNFENIKHISFYELSVEKGALFYENSSLNLPSELEKAKYEKEFNKTIKEHNFKRYEVSNYAKDGNYSMHNINYWRYNNYIGLGPSAHSTIDSTRIENKPDIKSYIRLDNHNSIYKLSKIEQMEEYLLMGLRLVDGINLNDFKDRFKILFCDIFEDTINSYSKYIIIDKKNIKLNSIGINILNKILVGFFKELEDKKCEVE